MPRLLMLYEICSAGFRQTCMWEPILEYAAVVWAPHTLSAITSIEKIQRYATRFICGDYSRYSSVTEMLQSLSLPTLSQRRDTAKVIFCTKFYIRLWMSQFQIII